MNSEILKLLKKINVDEPVLFYSYIDELIKNNSKKIIITANPEIVMLANSNKEFNDLFFKADTIVIPDGIGVVNSLRKIHNNKNIQRNTGVELVEYLLAKSSECNLRVIIYGSKQEVLNDLKKEIDIKYPNINIVGMFNGYTNAESDVRDFIIKNEADVVLVALGVPRQELFIGSFIDDISKGLCVGIGGSLDVLSGNVKRAPKFFINHNLEWLYRITTQPKRLKRFVKSNIVYIFKTL